MTGGWVYTVTDNPNTVLPGSNTTSFILRLADRTGDTNLANADGVSAFQPQQDITHMTDRQKNVLGTELEECGTDPITGFFRDGCCSTGRQDAGRHTVCAVVTEEFLQFSKSQGNDLMTPRPEFGFPGLKAGDKWCLCAMRWEEAHRAGCAPRVRLTATNEKTLEFATLEHLKAHQIDLN